MMTLLNCSPRTAPRRGFTLVELLVVLGIIGFLMALLLPSLTKARAQAKSVQCKSQLRQIGTILQIYWNNNNGYLFPMGLDAAGNERTFGTNVPPHERWPVIVFDVRTPNPPPYDLTLPYSEPGGLPTDPAVLAHMAAWPAAPFTPPFMRCPSDDPNPAEGHSYVLNKHLVDHDRKANSKNFNGRTASDVIVAGEKKTEERDYYMEKSDWFRIVERFRHGPRIGSNYLYFDTHVGTETYENAIIGVDPWDLGRDPDAPVDPDADPPAAG